MSSTKNCHIKNQSVCDYLDNQRNPKQISVNEMISTNYIDHCLYAHSNDIITIVYHSVLNKLKKKGVFMTAFLGQNDFEKNRIKRH